MYIGAHIRVTILSRSIHCSLLSQATWSQLLPDAMMEAACKALDAPLEELFHEQLRTLAAAWLGSTKPPALAMDP